MAIATAEEKVREFEGNELKAALNCWNAMSKLCINSHSIEAPTDWLPSNHLYLTRQSNGSVWVQISDENNQRMLGELMGGSKAGRGKPGEYFNRGISFPSLLDLGMALKALKVEVDLSIIGEKTAQRRV